MKYPRIEGAIKLKSFVKPMLAELSSRPAFTDSKYIFEIKWDGYRAVAEIDKENRLYSRNGTSFAKAFPAVYKELSRLTGPTIIDGEIVVYGRDGKPSFQLLQNYQSRQPYAIQYQVFDCLQYKGKDLRALPLIERKAILRKAIPESDVVRFCDHVETEGELLFEQILKLNLEGMIAKVASSKYINDRSKAWLKIKNHKFGDFVIIGFLHSASSVYFKSLVLGEMEHGALKYRGHVSGFTDRHIKELYSMLSALVVEKKPVTKHEKFDCSVSWVSPLYLCNVRYTEVTNEGVLRHPVYNGLKVR